MSTYKGSGVYVHHDSDDDAFKAYVAEVVARHFEGAPKYDAPMDPIERNRDHIRRKSAALGEIEAHLGEGDHRIAMLYADQQAQGAIYALFDMPVKKPKRYR